MLRQQLSHPRRTRPCNNSDMRTVITAKNLWDGTSLLDHPVVVIEDGRISSIGVRSISETPAQARVLDYPGATLAPSFFDVHIHGAAGHDLMEATPEAVQAVSGFLASRGTSAYLATTVTAPLDATLSALSGLATLVARPPEQAQARLLGVHLEGPFLSHARRGVHPPEYLLAPDLAVFDRLFEAAEGHIRLMTLAPELPGAVELTAHATARGVRVSAGHSDATAAQPRCTESPDAARSRSTASESAVSPLATSRPPSGVANSP